VRKRPWNWDTNTPERGVAVAREVRAGTVGVNRFKTDLAAPFGGFKDSGIGRELGPEGLSAYLRYQSVFA
jgi:betaine-aldehyde dehydrogenase